MAPIKLVYPVGSRPPGVQLQFQVEGQTIFKVPFGRSLPDTVPGWGSFYSNLAAALGASEEVAFRDITFGFQPVATFLKTEPVARLDLAVELVSFWMQAGGATTWNALSVGVMTFKTNPGTRMPSQT
eukprot:gene6684-biopygen1881